MKVRSLPGRSRWAGGEHPIVVGGVGREPRELRRDALDPAAAAGTAAHPCLRVGAPVPYSKRRGLSWAPFGSTAPARVALMAPTSLALSVAPPVPGPAPPSERPPESTARQKPPERQETPVQSHVVDARRAPPGGRRGRVLARRTLRRGHRRPRTGPEDAQEMPREAFAVDRGEAPRGSASGRVGARERIAAPVHRHTRPRSPSRRPRAVLRSRLAASARSLLPLRIGAREHIARVVHRDAQ